jgi:hypothetical protein
MKRRYLLRGVYLAFGIVLCIAIVILVRIGFSYDGKCGGFFPGMVAPNPCSLWEYLSGDMLVLAILLAVTYWPIALLVLLLPPVVGYLFDRRG